ncbi:hypothetical protein Oweho_3243 [Owenweeksia hongkongensis DSM 17368]|uniref:Helix-turn-helix domain-containing protein n=1 Tax=Owenweeksia hongkongensis (strain DSM 17368 / CIP 108786 / JCM 12287 / NRRL B-23963 / UST20020801) TaxID=926562 RepID=G8R494_OWEHD|nr:helix-turn-helix domain-containing protein [Owenweeksia hongkongensis]AEV34194.1 hypothetical protein Oweho_3243 [Owenweeksia hongkongensis DSM 17368]
MKKLTPNINEDFDVLKEEIQFLSEDLLIPGNLPDIESCNLVVARLAIFESDLKSMKRIVQDQKDDFITDKGSQSENPGRTGKLIQLPAANDELLSVVQAADRLGCTRQTVYKRHIPEGLKVVYPAGKKGNKKIRASDLANYIAGLQSA